MRKIISLVIALVLLLSLSGCKNNVAQKLTVYNATFTMSAQYELTDRDLSSTMCFPMTWEFYANTSVNVIVSDRTLNLVAEELNNDLTASEIRPMLSVEVLEDASALKVCVTSRDAQRSLNVAQAIAGIAPDIISSLLENASVRLMDAPKVIQETSLRNLFR